MARPVAAWGHAFGIRLRKSELARPGVKPGKRLHITLEAEGGPNPLERLALFKFGPGPDADAILEEEMVEESRRSSIPVS
ncbi:MAG: hypothetical protein ACYDBQ_12225 [Thermoplasmatota archaeon]